MKKPIYKRIWFWLIIVAVVIIVIGTTVGENNNDVDTPDDSLISDTTVATDKSKFLKR